MVVAAGSAGSAAALLQGAAVDGDPLGDREGRDWAVRDYRAKTGNPGLALRRPDSRKLIQLYITALIGGLRGSCPYELVLDGCVTAVIAVKLGRALVPLPPLVTLSDRGRRSTSELVSDAS